MLRYLRNTILSNSSLVVGRKSSTPLYQTFPDSKLALEMIKGNTGMTEGNILRKCCWSKTCLSLARWSFCIETTRMEHPMLSERRLPNQCDLEKMLMRKDLRVKPNKTTVIPQRVVWKATGMIYFTNNTEVFVVSAKSQNKPVWGHVL